MTEKDKMINGMLYMASDESIQSISSENRKLIEAFNEAKGEERKNRMEYIRKAFAHTGKNAYIEPPFYCDHGWNISVGDNFYANTGVIILDQCPVTIGNNVMLAPRVSIYCACHPIDAFVRNTLYELGKPVTIGNDVWIGGNTVINPGVTIGNNVVIGSGSVVTHDIPDNVIAAGNPCRVLRKITEKDHEYWLERLHNECPEFN